MPLSLVFDVLEICRSLKDNYGASPLFERGYNQEMVPVLWGVALLRARGRIAGQFVLNGSIQLPSLSQIGNLLHCDSISTGLITAPHSPLLFAFEGGESS